MMLPANNKMQCIYCLRDKPASNFSKVEHVIPQAFGVFKNNLTLRDIVCDECNQYFGNHLEIALARDTVEGISRFEFGVKKPNEFRSLGKKSRMRIEVEEGPCMGAYSYLGYSEEQKKVVIIPTSQIGFLKASTNEYVYFLPENVPQKKHLEENGFDLNHPQGICVLGMKVEEAKRVLLQKGIQFEVKGESGPPSSGENDWRCQVEATIDSTIFRSIAKMAFSYLAYWEGASFVLHSSFNPIRNFVRYGDQAAFPLVRVDETAILGDEPVEGKRRLGHIITVNWAGDRVSIVSQVTLFNLMTYVVSIARDFTGERKQIRRGHFFNLFDRQIIELDAGPKNFISADRPKKPTKTGRRNTGAAPAGG